MFARYRKWRGEGSSLQGSPSVQRRNLRQKLQQEVPAHEVPRAVVNQEGIRRCGSNRGSDSSLRISPAVCRVSGGAVRRHHRTRQRRERLRRILCHVPPLPDQCIL